LDNVLTDNWITEPSHTGELLAATATGTASTTTVVVVVAGKHPVMIIVKLYVPAFADTTFEIIGFCKLLVNPLGPVQEYVAPTIVAANKLIFPPAHTGELLAILLTGPVFTTTVVEEVEGLHPGLLTVSWYVPPDNKVVGLTEGFCKLLVNPLGPVQEYVAPEIVFEVKFNTEPSQIGELLAGFETGSALIETVTFEVTGLQPGTVRVAVYTPDWDETVELILGFCKLLVNPFGPVQEYVAPEIVFEVKFNTEPSQIGLLLDTVKVGPALTITFTDPVAFEHPGIFVVTVTEYKPAFETVAAFIDGFWSVLVNPLGPIQE
jgi:hypothetical protein